ASYEGIYFLKVVLYYLLLISVVNSTERLRTFLGSIALFATVNATVAILHYYGIVEVPSLSVLEYAESIDPETGLPVMFRRMQATGIFGDPNDLAMIAVLGIVLSINRLGDRASGGSRLLWIVPLALL